MATISNKQLIEIEKSIALSQKDRETMRKDIEEIKTTMKEFALEFKEFKDNLHKDFPKKSSVDKLRVIVWGIIGFFFSAIGYQYIQSILETISKK